MQEVEIKFRVADEAALLQRAERAGFELTTPATREQNTLYDTPDRQLRQRGQLVRLRRYGSRSVLTHKSRPADLAEHAERHKRRMEHETVVDDPDATDAILRGLGFAPVFSYEKYRAEWSDGIGHMVVDITPLGTLCELEGMPDWIDRTAAALGIPQEQYMTASYGTLFTEWKEASRSPAMNMTFEEMHVPVPSRFTRGLR